VEPEWSGEIASIYRELSARAAARACSGQAACCRFRLTGRVPMLTRAEALLAARAVRATGRKQVAERADGACPMLDGDARCTIYAQRPFGCRTHFCATAGGILPRKSLADLIQRLDALDEALGGDGPKPLLRAVQAVLATDGRRRLGH